MCRKANGLYLFLIIWYVVGSVAFAVIAGIAGLDVPLWLQFVQTYIMLAPPVIVYILMNKIHPSRHFAFRVLKPADVILSILFGYSLVPMMLFLNQLTMFFVDNHLDESSMELYQSYPFVVQLVLMALIPAVAEEFIFRGVLYHSFRKNGILGAAFMSALMFGLFHLNLNQFVYAFVLGLAFALLVEATGSLYSSMLAHAACNSYSLIIMQLVPSEMFEVDYTETTFATQAVALVFLAVIAAVFCTVAYFLYVKLAGRNKRVIYMAEKFSMGLKAQNGERFVTLAFVLALVFALLVMFWVDFGAALIYN